MLDTSAIIEAFDRGRSDLLRELVESYEELLIPWVVVYEYTMGHRLLSRDPGARKKALEEQGLIVVRQVGTKHTYVLAPDFRSCGTCHKFYFCEKVRGVPRRERLERPACDEYEPEVEGHA